VLGYVPVDYFLGGEMTVDAELARDSLSGIAERLSLDIPGAALAVNTTVNANMADAITEVCTKKGHDVRDFVLVAGGGAGGIHAAPVAALLHLPEIVFPPAGALLSAQGMLIMDLGQELARSEAWLGGEGVSEARLKRAFEEMIETQQLTFARAGVDTSAAKFVRSVEMRYEGQYHAVEVQLPDRKIDASTLEALLSAFHDRYRALYGYSMPGRAVELMQLHVRGSIPSAVRKVPVTAPASAAPDPGEARRGSRSCVTASGPVDFPVYDRDLLRPATRFHGPALIDSTTTTVLVPEGFAAEVDQYLNIVVRMVPTGDAAARSNHLVAVAR
jgi:N-methylhydantoinase A